MGRRIYVTPTSYIDLFSTFTTLIEKKQQSVSKARERYLCGLDKLSFASSQVEQHIIIISNSYSMENEKINYSNKGVRHAKRTRKLKATTDTHV